MPPTETTANPPQDAPKSSSIFDELDREESASEADPQGTTSAAATEEETTDQTAATTAESETEEADTDWLPNEQEKVFTPEVYAKYAKRYGYTAEEAADPRNQRLLHDKINSDIEIQRRKQAEEALAAQTEEEDPSSEEEQAVSVPTVDPAKLAEGWEKAVSEYVEKNTDPRLAEKFVSDLGEVEKITDPKQRAVAFTKVMSRGAINLVKDVIPEIVFGKGPDGKSLADKWLEQDYEALPTMYKQQSRQATWERLRTSNESFKTAPQFGTPEWDAAIQGVAEMVPGFEDAVYLDKNGNKLSPEKNFEKKSLIALTLLSRQKLSKPAVEQTKQAIETGKKLARDADRNKQLGKLGAGQTKGQIAQRVTNNDDLFGEGEQEYKDRHQRI